MYRWERGLHGPRARSLALVAGVLGVAPGYLLEGDRREVGIPFTRDPVIIFVIVCCEICVLLTSGVSWYVPVGT